MKEFDDCINPMMEELYYRLLKDVKEKNKNSVIYRHHVNFVNETYYDRPYPYENTEPNQIVVDFIASMTDDYFIDLYEFLFPDSKRRVKYIGYFDRANRS